MACQGEEPSPELLGALAALFNEWAGLLEAQGREWLIRQIGRWVLRTACQQAREWQTVAPYPIPVAVNLSARQFYRDDLARVLGEFGPEQGDGAWLDARFGDVVVALDRQGLLRDISEVFAKERLNVIGVHTQSAKDRSTAWMTFTVEVPDTARLAHERREQVLDQLAHRAPPAAGGSLARGRTPRPLRPRRQRTSTPLRRQIPSLRLRLHRPRPSAGRCAATGSGTSSPTTRGSRPTTSRSTASPPLASSRTTQT